MPTITLALDPTAALEARIRAEMDAQNRGTWIIDGDDELGDPIRKYLPAPLRPRMANHAKASATSELLTIPVAHDVRLSVASTKPPWPAPGSITVELLDPSSDTILTSHTISATSALPWETVVALSGRHPTSVVVLVHGHDAGALVPISVSVGVDAVPWE